MTDTTDRHAIIQGMDISDEDEANGIKDVRKAQQYFNCLINYLETGKHVW